MTLVEKLEKLKRKHEIDYDEDYLSCPKSFAVGDYLYSDHCNCGADEHNALVDECIDEIRRSMKQ